MDEKTNTGYEGIFQGNNGYYYSRYIGQSCIVSGELEKIFNRTSTEATLIALIREKDLEDIITFYEKKLKTKIQRATP